MRKALSIYPVELPSLPKLLHLEIPEKVGASYYKFGVFLLNDETGSLLDASLKSECRGKPDRITRKILQQWLEGERVACDLANPHQDAQGLETLNSGRPDRGYLFSSATPTTVFRW